MDLATIATLVELLINTASNPVGERAIAAARKPRTADLSTASSLGETGEAILRCYHPTGRFRSTEVAQRPWAKAGQFDAAASMLLRIEWNGALLKTPYTMQVAVIERNGQIRTVVQDDDALVPQSPRCALNQWQEAALPALRPSSTVRPVPAASPAPLQPSAYASSLEIYNRERAKQPTDEQVRYGEELGCLTFIQRTDRKRSRGSAWQRSFGSAAGLYRSAQAGHPPGKYTFLRIDIMTAVSELRPGDLLLWDPATSSGYGHIARILSTDPHISSVLVEQRNYASAHYPADTPEFKDTAQIASSSFGRPNQPVAALLWRE